jgi:hypothetical protein
MINTLYNHILTTMSYSALYLFLFSILLFITVIVIGKILYHSYLNIYLLIYSLTVTEWLTIPTSQTNYTLNIVNNLFCSISFFNTQPNKLYFDIIILSEQCNITAPCVSNRTMNIINNTLSLNINDFVYGKSFLFSNCMYDQIILDTREILIFVIIITFTLLLLIYTLYNCCKQKIN